MVLRNVELFANHQFSAQPQRRHSRPIFERSCRLQREISGDFRHKQSEHLRVGITKVSDGIFAVTLLYINVVDFRNEKEQLVCAALMSHFLVPAPFLSFHILEAGTRNVPFCFNNSSEDLCDIEDDFDEEAEICVSYRVTILCAAC